MATYTIRYTINKCTKTRYGMDMFKLIELFENLADLEMLGNSVKIVFTREERR